MQAVAIIAVGGNSVVNINDKDSNITKYKALADIVLLSHWSKQEDAGI